MHNCIQLFGSWFVCFYVFACFFRSTLSFGFFWVAFIFDQHFPLYLPSRFSRKDALVWLCSYLILSIRLFSSLVITFVSSCPDVHLYCSIDDQSKHRLAIRLTFHSSFFFWLISVSIAVLHPYLLCRLVLNVLPVTDLFGHKPHTPLLINLLLDLALSFIAVP